MGQTVTIRDVALLGDTLLVDTDRSFTGQDGQTLTPDFTGDSVLGRLAAALFGLGVGIDHVHVLQNTISVRGSSAWDQAAIDRVRMATGDLLRFYNS
jgi:hypothetical protein